jgi:epsin
VRQKAKDVRALLQDDDRIREERARAKRNRGKFTGVSAAEMRRGGGGGGGSSSRYGGFENFGRSSNCMLPADESRHNMHGALTG